MKAWNESRTWARQSFWHLAIYFEIVGATSMTAIFGYLAHVDGELSWRRFAYIALVSAICNFAAAITTWFAYRALKKGFNLRYKDDP